MRASAAALLLVIVIVAASCGGRRSSGSSTDGPGAEAVVAPPSDAETPAPDVVEAGSPEALPELDAAVPGDAPPTTDALPAEAAPIEAAATDAAATDALPARTPYKAIAITSGRYHVCALLEDHRVKCWGSNAYGQLGLGDANERGLGTVDMGDNLPTIDLGTGRTAKAITAGRYATCALLDDASVKCWGWGGLAVGERVDPNNSLIGDAPGEMGDALRAVDLGPGRTAKDVALGYYNGCVIRDNDSVKCWGSSSRNEEYPPSIGRRLVRLAGGRGVLGVDTDGRVVAVSHGFEQPVPDAGATLKALAIAGSESTVCAIFEGDVVSCSALSGTSFHTTFPTTYPSPLAALGITQLRHACWMLKDGRVECLNPSPAENPWSVAVAGRSHPSVRLGEPAVTITANGTDDFFCALLVSGEVKCWRYSPRNTERAGRQRRDGHGVAVGRFLGTRPAP